MQLTFEVFLVRKLLAACCDLVLRLDVDRVRPGRLGIRLGRAAAKPTADPFDLQPGGEAFEVALLLVGEVDGNCFKFHGADVPYSAALCAATGAATMDCFAGL